MTHPRRVLAVAVLLSFASLGSGCWRPLAHQHEYFSTLGGTAGRISAEAHHTVDHYRALQAASHACPSLAFAGHGAASPPSVPSPDASVAAEGRDALAALCDSPGRPGVAAHGGALNAYGRWVQDAVRDLPSTSQTGAGAAGGS